MAEEKWILGKETVVELPNGMRELGYTVLAWSQPFNSFEEASSYIMEHKLPLGWVAMRSSQRPWGVLFPKQN